MCWRLPGIETKAGSDGLACGVCRKGRSVNVLAPVVERRRDENGAAKTPAEQVVMAMQEETFKSRLDIYYIATIAYCVTLIAYIVVTGTLIGGKLEVVWRDPIVYLLGACAVLSLLALALAAVANRAVIVSERELRFRTRFKERVFRPEDIEWIAFRRERRLREGRVYPTARIRLRSRRRALRLRPGSFERSGMLALAIRDFARHNGIDLRVASSLRSRLGRNERRNGDQ